MCEGVEFRVCLRVESLDFRVEGCEFEGLRFLFFRVQDLVLGLGCSECSVSGHELRVGLGVCRA